MFALLSLEIDEGIDSTQRERFNDYLKEGNWIKVPKIDTTWYASFNGNLTEYDIISIAKDNVSEAANKSGVNSYIYIVNVGIYAPVIVNNFNNPKKLNSENVYQK